MAGRRLRVNHDQSVRKLTRPMAEARGFLLRRDVPHCGSYSHSIGVTFPSARRYVLSLLWFRSLVIASGNVRRKATQDVYTLVLLPAGTIYCGTAKHYFVVNVPIHLFSHKQAKPEVE
jgi:hypothetical protein